MLLAIISRGARRPRGGWIATLLFLATAAVPSIAAAPTEYEVNAAFLFNFTKFVEWPPQRFADPQAPIIIGVLGADPFGEVLDEAVRGKRVNGRPFKVERYSLSDDFVNCHVLFISVERRRLSSVLEKLASQPVLTVGEVDEFARHGGVVNFLKEENRIRFQINVDSARRADLKLHSSLLNLARIVRNGR